VHDKAITPEFLQAVCKRRLGIDPFMLDADHSPFLSATEELANLFDAVAAEAPLV
jgi:hypothetical protein